MIIRTKKGLDNNNMNLALIRLEKFLKKAEEVYNKNLLDFEGNLQNLGYKPK
jgi:hypothetical protein